MIRIVAPHFVAGVTLLENTVFRTAPILSYMFGWHKDRVFDYCKKKGWEATEL